MGRLYEISGDFGPHSPKNSMKNSAHHIRRVTATTDLETTLKRAVNVLNFFNIPHFVIGGYAVQERGYPRLTTDVDIVVPNVMEAREKLCMNGFKENKGSNMTITDRKNQVEIDILPGGKRISKGPLPLPMPSKVSDVPQILDLKILISIKLSSYIGNPATRIQDLADVTILMKNNKLPRDYPVKQEVKALYQKTWDDLKAEEAAESLFE